MTTSDLALIEAKADGTFPNFWNKVRASSGPLKFTFRDNTEHNVCTALLMLVQGIHNSGSGYEFFCSNDRYVDAYRYGDYMGAIRIGRISNNTGESSYIIRSRNVNKKRARGLLSDTETYSNSVEKAVTIASGLFSRPSVVQLFEAMKKYISEVLSSNMIRNFYSEPSQANQMANFFYTDLRMRQPTNLQGKTVVLRSMGKILRAHKQATQDVSWDVYDESLNMDTAIAELLSHFNCPNMFNFETFMSEYDKYEQGSLITNMLKKKGILVLVSLSGAVLIVKYNSAISGNTITSHLRFTDMDTDYFPVAVKNAVNTLYSIGPFHYTKDVGVMLTDPKIPPYESRQFMEGFMFYLEHEVANW